MYRGDFILGQRFKSDSGPDIFVPTSDSEIVLTDSLLMCSMTSCQ